jgi:hypothetical protein
MRNGLARYTIRRIDWYEFEGWHQHPEVRHLVLMDRLTSHGQRFVVAPRSGSQVLIEPDGQPTKFRR